MHPAAARLCPLSQSSKHSVAPRGHPQAPPQLLATPLHFSAPLLHSFFSPSCAPSLPPPLPAFPSVCSLVSLLLFPHCPPSTPQHPFPAPPPLLSTPFLPPLHSSAPLSLPPLYPSAPPSFLLSLPPHLPPCPPPLLLFTASCSNASAALSASSSAGAGAFPRRATISPGQTRTHP